MWKKTLAALTLTALLGSGAQAQWIPPDPTLRNLDGQGVVYAPEARLNNIFQRVVQNTSRRDITYQLLVEQDDSTVNAYALPDGRLVLLTGLLNNLPPGDDNALAFVIAHELSHLERRHIEKLNTQSGLTNLALGWLTRSSGDAVRGLAGVGSRLLTSGYSRGMEAEADANGLELMQKAGYDPRGALVALRLFQELEERHGRARIFPTHPTATDRLKDTQAYLSSRGY